MSWDHFFVLTAMMVIGFWKITSVIGSLQARVFDLEEQIKFLKGGDDNDDEDEA